MAGNANSGPRKTKLFRDALLMELSIRDAGEEGKTLRAIAGGVIEASLEKKLDATKELIDRLDGKPAQAIIGGDEDDNPMRTITTIELIAHHLDEHSPS